MISACLLIAPARADAPMTRDQALAAVTAPSWPERLSAAQTLLEIGGPEDVSALVTLTGDAELAVVRVSADALAKLGTPEALSALEAMLTQRHEERREAAALSWLRWQLEIDDAFLTRLRLQVKSEDGRRWLSARPVLRDLLATQPQRDALTSRLRTLQTRYERACVEAARAKYGVALPDPFPTREALLARWRRGRLESLMITREALQNTSEVAELMIVEVEQQCQEGVTSSGPPPGTPGMPGTPGTPAQSGWTQVDEKDRLFFRIAGWGGHDNNTFLLRPVLTVTEPGHPDEGKPIDLVRDDTLGGAEGELRWQHRFAGKTRTLKPWAGVYSRHQQLTVRLKGGFSGRLRWGQLMGAFGEVRALYDRFVPSDTLDEASHFRVDVRGGLEVPGDAAEMDLWLFPTDRLMTVARVYYAEGETPKRRRAPMVPSWSVESRLRLVHPIFKAPVTMPEQTAVESVTRGTLTGELSDTLQTRLGGSAEVAVHHGEGGVAAGVSVGGGALLTTLIIKDHWLEIEAGYGGAFPLVSSGMVSFEAGQPLVSAALSPLHGPLFAGNYRWIDGEGDDIYIAMTLSVSQQLRPAGREGWAAYATLSEAILEILTPDEVKLFELGFFGARASYALGESVAAPDHSDRTQWGVRLEFPFFFDESFSLTLRSQGRLVADDARFNGDFTGQFRVLLIGQIFFDERF